MEQQLDALDWRHHDVHGGPHQRQRHQIPLELPDPPRCRRRPMDSSIPALAAAARWTPPLPPMPPLGTSLGGQPVDQVEAGSQPGMKL